MHTYIEYRTHICSYIVTNCKSYMWFQNETSIFVGNTDSDTKRVKLVSVCVCFWIMCCTRKMGFLMTHHKYPHKYTKARVCFERVFGSGYIWKQLWTKRASSFWTLGASTTLWWWWMHRNGFVSGFFKWEIGLSKCVSWLIWITYISLLVNR